MVVRSGSEPLSVRLDPRDFARLAKEVRQFGPELSKALRKNIREAAKPAVKDVQQRLMGRTFKTDTGLARGLAAGTKVSIRTGARTAGVSITTTGAKLPADKQPMVRAYNKPSFRHQVFGHTDRWVTQKGRPYFGQVLDNHRADMEAAIEQAVVDAARTIRSAEVTGR